MKFVDFTSLLETEPANLAALSTFQFDPDFFERRVLRCPALVKARRVVVFMDSSQWLKLLRQDVSARLLNRRYLVVPIRPPKGVFHPKLNLFLREDGGQVQCGSNNLTRSGCTSNLELLNSFTITLDSTDLDAMRLGKEAYTFFLRACDDADQETGRIARQWIEEAGQDIPWLSAELPASDPRLVRLLDTYNGSLWDHLSAMLGTGGPKRLLVISPFFDQKAELAQRFRQRWPKCQIEFVVQHQTTNLPIVPLQKLGKGITLSELRNSSRRLHAKLLAWESEQGTGCLVGSANFTLAAYDARNIETCLLLSDAKDLVSGLFDGQLAKRPLSFDDFNPGTEQEPEPESVETATVRLESALLTETGEIKVSYWHRLPTKPSNLRLAIRTPREERPRALPSVPNKENFTAIVNPGNSVLRDAQGTILASLIAELGNERVESPPIWVIQESLLTYEPSGEGLSSVKSKVEETGAGLTEFLEELGKRDGIAAVIEYLKHQNIRFNDGGGGLHRGRTFRLRIRDPFHADLAPDWLLNAKDNTNDLAEAVYDFVDRHEKQRLRRHSRRGNINGMENFLDIFTALVRLLYIYHVRGVVHRLKLIGKVINYIEIATHGWDTEGYLSSVSENLNDSGYLQEVCKELNFLGHIWAALVLVQRLRFVPNEKSTWGPPPKRPSECLPDHRNRLREFIKEIGLEKPSKASIMQALGEYSMFSKAELSEMEKEIAI